MKVFTAILLACLNLVPTNVLAIVFEGQKLVIAGPSPYAIEAGKRVYEQGGNVFDVSVTVALVLSVVSPYYAALGGGGFALIRKAGESPSALDFREVAPSTMGPKFFEKKGPRDSVDGPLAVGVPGIPAGLWELHKKYGRLHWSRLFNEAIDLAERGFLVSGEWVRETEKNKERFNKAGKSIFFGKEGQSLKPGDRHRHKALAKVLKEMRNRGITSFYRGSVANDIIESLERLGGVMSKQDLETYSPRWLTPIEENFGKARVFLMPPPSSGGHIVSLALRLAEKQNLKKVPLFSVEEFHLLGEILSRGFRLRGLIGDPSFVGKDWESHFAEDRLKDILKTIDQKKTVKLDPIGKLDPTGKKEVNAKTDGETTHFSVIDQAGNAVAMTLTLNASYGSGVVTEKYGIALNNEIDDFSTRLNQPNLYGLVQGEANRVQGGKRPLSSMTPTLVTTADGSMLSLGAPGGPRIISSVFQVLYRVLARDMDLDLAVQAPRIHHQFIPHTLFIDPARFSHETIEGLKSLGHDIKESSIGKVYVVKRRSDGILEGAFDSRGEGAVGGF